MIQQNTEFAVIEQETKKEITDVVAQAQGFVIKTQDDYDKMSVFLVGVKKLIKKVGEAFDPVVEAAHKSWKVAVAQRKEQLDPLEQAERIVKSRGVEFLVEQERIRAEEERKARAEAEAAERKRKAELEAQAQRHEANGNIAKAEERREMAEQVFVAPRPVVAGAIKAEGQSLKEVWSAEVVDLAALVKAVAEGRAPITLVMADQTALNKQAKATKDAFPIPGVRFFSTKQMAVRV